LLNKVSVFERPFRATKPLAWYIVPTTRSHILICIVMMHILSKRLYDVLFVLLEVVHGSMRPCTTVEFKVTRKL
jgi:hypothetical protein